MRQIINLTADAKQEHIILFNESQITLNLNYYDTIQKWFFSVQYNAFSLNNMKLSLGVLHMLSENQPFDFIVTDERNTGLDPFSINDFSDNRCLLYFLEPDDMEKIRGYKVPL